MNTLLRVTATILIPLLLILGLYVQMHGEISPGGGFQAGVIVAAGFVLFDRGLSRGQTTVLSRNLLLKLSAIGVMVYLTTGIIPLLMGHGFLETVAIIEKHPVLSNEIGVTIIELGVGITVFSSVLLLYEIFSEFLRRMKNDW